MRRETIFHSDVPGGPRWFQERVKHMKVRIRSENVGLWGHKNVVSMYNPTIEIGVLNDNLVRTCHIGNNEKHTKS